MTLKLKGLQSLLTTPFYYINYMFLSNNIWLTSKRSQHTLPQVKFDLFFNHPWTFQFNTNSQTIQWTKRINDTSNLPAILKQCVIKLTSVVCILFKHQSVCNIVLNYFLYSRFTKLRSKISIPAHTQLDTIRLYPPEAIVTYIPPRLLASCEILIEETSYIDSAHKQYCDMNLSKLLHCDMERCYALCTDVLIKLSKGKIFLIIHNVL